MAGRQSLDQIESLSLEDLTLLATRHFHHQRQRAEQAAQERRRADRRAGMIAAAVCNQMARNWGGKANWEPQHFLWMLSEPEDQAAMAPVIDELFHEAIMKGMALNRIALAEQARR